MFLLSDIITYMRRILKTPSNTSITDGLLIDYINRFWIVDVDARLQLFDLKTKYQFFTTPGVDQYNMPLYDVQVQDPGSQSQNINFYPVYQGFLSACYINGINAPLQTQKNIFFNSWPNVIQKYNAIVTGDNGPNYTIQLPILPSISPQNPPFNPILRGHIDMTGIIATGNNIDPPTGSSFPIIPSSTAAISIPVTSMFPMVWITTIDEDGNNMIVSDSGVFLDTDINYGLLMSPGKAPFGNQALSSNNYSTALNTVNYLTGTINVTFPENVPAGNNINVQCYFFQTGVPRSILIYNNVLTLRNVPDSQYLVELDAYLTPAAFLNTSQAVQFGYMSEYIARGAARKILSDTGDVEQLDFYEPMFKEQENLVWKRSQRQWTATRTQTIYSQGNGDGFGGYGNNFGGIR